MGYREERAATRDVIKTYNLMGLDDLKQAAPAFAWDAWGRNTALTNLLGPSFYRTFESSCVPFSWVDPGSREKDSCQFQQVALDDSVHCL